MKQPYRVVIQGALMSCRGSYGFRLNGKDSLWWGDASGYPLAAALTLANNLRIIGGGKLVIGYSRPFPILPISYSITNVPSDFAKVALSELSKVDAKKPSEFSLSDTQKVMDACSGEFSKLIQLIGVPALGSLENTHRNIATFFSGLPLCVFAKAGVMPIDNDYINDDVWCEAANIINFDKATLETYVPRGNNPNYLEFLGSRYNNELVLETYLYDLDNLQNDMEKLGFIE